ncbi:hypothetical protein WG904_12200 [Pedobacter sp. Du54]|uniref:hypothetical protein n=1 Tax=Pedobacter anseongensis TaxID=3133439 RepID=UPI0030AED51E
MKRSVTPEMVMQNFAKYGQEIDLENAEKVLDLMYDLSALSVKTEIEAALQNGKCSRSTIRGAMGLEHKNCGNNLIIKVFEKNKLLSKLCLYLSNTLKS